MPSFDFVSPLNVPERILVFGPPGSGKSTGVLSIARKIAGKMFILDSEVNNHERLLGTDFMDVAETGRVEVRTVWDWTDYISNAREIAGIVDPNDWFVIDSFTPSWDEVQTFFVEQVFGKDVGNFFMQFRIEQEQGKGGRKVNPLEGWKDYSVINKVYNELYRIIMNMPCNVYLTAEATDVSNETDDKDTRTMFGGFRVKPKGQKRLGFIPHTVLLTGVDRQANYSLTTVKDRGREKMVSRQINNFAEDYLGDVAGWKRKMMKGGEGA